MYYASTLLFFFSRRSVFQRPRQAAFVLAFGLGAFGTLTFCAMPSLAQAVLSAADGEEESGSIASQVQAQIAVASGFAQQGNLTLAIEQLNQAIALAQSIQDIAIRDQSLYAVGTAALLQNSGFEQVLAIAQAMTYDTVGTSGQLRVVLEQALITAYEDKITAYIAADQLSQAIELIEPLPVDLKIQQANYLIERLTNTDKIDADKILVAASLVERLIPAEYRYQATSSISRAYTAAEKFEAARAFLQAQPFADPSDQARALGDLAQQAGIAGQLETASAIAEEIVETRRTATLVELARLYHYRGQSEKALDLLQKATQMPADPDDLQSGWSNAKLIAIAYADLGQPTLALNVLDKAGAMPLEGDSYFPLARIDAYIEIGAIERAATVLESFSAENPINEGQLRLATAYVERSQYSQALALLAQIPDGVLRPLVDYPDPKVELISRILSEALEKEDFDIAKATLQTQASPISQVSTRVAIAAAYPAAQRTDAIAALDQALAIAKTIEGETVVIDRHLSYQKSNADLLTAIANGYRSIDQSDQAISTIRTALASLQTLQTDFFMGLNGVPNGEIDYAAIAMLARDWQQWDFYETALDGLENRLAKSEAAANNNTPLPEGTLSIAEQIWGLAGLSYVQDRPPSERYARYYERLEAMRTQAMTTPEAPSEQQITEQLSLLSSLIEIYHNIDQPQVSEAIARYMSEPIRQLPASDRDAYLQSLTLSTATISASQSDQPPPLVQDILSQITSPQVQADTLRILAAESASVDNSALATVYFDELLRLNESSLSASDRDLFWVNLANTFVFSTADTPNLPPITSAQVALMTRILPQIRDPLLRATVAISFAPNLPAAESTQTYAVLAETLAQIPNTATKRALIWQSLSQAISLNLFDHATQLANALDAEYRFTALGWIETLRPKNSNLSVLPARP